MIWFNRLILASVLLALCVAVFGAYVRLTDAGLGCPDWPGCFGTLTVPESQEAILLAQQEYPDSFVDVGKAWREMIHRYIAAILGVFVLLITYLAYKNKNDINVRLKTVYTLLALIIFQGLLGMWTVTELLKPAIVSAHLIGGMSTLGLLTYIAHRQHGSISNTIIINPGIKFFVRFALVLLFVQILLGGWTSTNYAALACTDYPTCHGSLIPEMDFANGFTIFRDLGVNAYGDPLSIEALYAIQWVHRVGAIVLTIYLCLLAYFLKAYPGLNIYRGLLILAIILQFIIGVANLLFYLPIALATMHNLGAALLVIILVIINSRITQNYDQGNI